MLIGVKTYRGAVFPDRFMEVPVENTEWAQKIAFRRVYRRLEKDFQELMDMTTRIHSESVSQEVSETLLSMRK